jgi:hypothetical protein
MNNNLTETGVFPEIEKCGIKWKIISSELKFSKPNCYDIFNVIVKNKNNIYVFDWINRVDFKCSLRYLEWW